MQHHDRTLPFIVALPWLLVLCMSGLLPAAVASQNGASAPVTTPAESTASRAARLERLVHALEQRRTELHVAGMAIAIVHDDEVVLMRGFGEMNLETHQPVTEDTIFAVGSTTKAFTAALIGMLIDEGKMAWSDPITKYLPYFTLAINVEDASAEGDSAENDHPEVTITDLLSHRTGFTRMSLLWAGGTATPDQILRTAATAQPYKPYRSAFLYNNVMYLAAGEAAGVAAESDWESLMHRRILQPLHMKSATTSVTEAKKNSNLALGYLWNEEKGEFEHQPMRELDSIKPAGAINASAKDMTEWVRFQLDRGEVGRTRLISEAQIEETWKRHNSIAPSLGYGLGWMLREWNGRRVIEHGGNIDGFAAQVALMPEEDLGFVLLMNVSASPLQNLSMEMVWEALLGEEREGDDAAADDADDADDVDDAGEPNPIDRAQLVGEYIANFAHFKNVTFTVLERDGKLAVDVPGQTTFDLSEPDREGKWELEGVPGAFLSFDRNEAGEVFSMTLHQGGFMFELPKEGADQPIDFKREDVIDLLGRYHFEERNHEPTVIFRRGRVAIDVPGQMVFELHSPDAENRWAFRSKPDIQIEFHRNDEGKVEALTLYQSGMEFRMPKVADAEEAKVEGGETLPTRDDLFAVMRFDERKAALERLGGVRMRGTVKIVHAGAEGTFLELFDGPERERQEIDFGVFGSMTGIMNGERAWTISTFSPDDEIEGKKLLETRALSPVTLIGDWRRAYDTIEVTEVREREGRTRWAVKLQAGVLPAFEAEIDPETGDLLSLQAVEIMPGIGSLPMMFEMSDYVDVQGLRIPKRMSSENEATGRSVTVIETIETGQTFEESLFTHEMMKDS